MSKSIYKEAVETLNKYRNQNYNSTNKDEVELANAINVILPNYVKQEKLLELYRELMVVKDLLISRYNYFVNLETAKKLEKQIKELENDI